jgi:trehalose 6-phosphate synthase/phosphatase
MIEKARWLMEHFGFHANESNCALEAKPPVEWNKGRASIYILRTAFGVDWSERIKIIYCGDGSDDEDALLVSTLLKRSELNNIEKLF